tara:strand:- start:197 stop:919 length:723 start_codon:yes stop_codon:yes gene_type:complete
MNIIKRNIPNFITLINLTAGLYSIILTFNNHIILASILILSGSILDFLDGLTARVLNANSELGKQLDSMADLITFGVAPGIILFTLIDNASTDLLYDYIPQIIYSKTKFIALSIPIFSAIRLSKFNIDHRQSTSFIGLPTPIVAIFIASLPIVTLEQETVIFTDKILLTFIALFFSFLLISKIHFFSLKKNSEKLDKKENTLKFLTIILAIVLLLIFKLSSIPFIVILYIILAIINNIIK